MPVPCPYNPVMRMPKHRLHHPSAAVAAPGLRLPAWQRRGFYLLLALLTLSGVAWLAAHFFLRPVSAFGVSVNPLEPWSMKLHGGAAMVAFWLVGSMLHLHIRRGLALRRNLIAGWSMLVVLTVLAVTGYALYYIAGEDSRPLWSTLHWIIGLLLAPLVLLHVSSGRRSRPG